MRSIRCLLFVVLWVATVSPALALRCDSDLIQEGDNKFKLVQKCGEPLSVELVGYTLDKTGNREMVIEHLVYGPWDGWYYQIEIVGGRVYKIESFR